MKKITISIAMLMGLNGFSQMSESKKIATGDGWYIKMNIENTTDTTTFFFYGYQNKKYSSITDIGGVGFSQKNDLTDFANALKTLSTKESGISVKFSIGVCSVELHDFADEIFITDSRGKYTYITKKQAVKMADEFIANANLLRK